MKWKQKTNIISAFAFRLPMIALSAYHLHTVILYLQSDSPLLALTESLVLIQVMLVWSAISATIPNMRGFIKSFAFNFGVKSARPIHETWGFELQTIGGSLQFVSANSNAASTWLRTNPNRLPQRRPVSAYPELEDDEALPNLRPDSFMHTTTITHSTADSHLIAEDESMSLSRAGSHEMIIKKDVHWDVSTTSGSVQGNGRGK